MDTSLTQTQRELLAVLPAELSPTDLKHWKARLIAGFSRAKIYEEHPENAAMLHEPQTTYAPTAADEPLTLSIPRTWLDDVFLKKIMNWLEFKRTIEASQLTEQQALALGKEAKQGWWEQNKNWVMEKIGAA